jgi:hypothetical protein
MNTDELRKMAEASLKAEETWHHEADLHGSLACTYGEAGNHYVKQDAAFIAAASPAAVLALLAERDEARAAVKRLAGALELLESNVFEDGAPDEALELALVALQDPVVKRIVEE